MKLQFFPVFFQFHFPRSSQGFIQNHVIPKIIIIPYIMASIISHALSLTGMSVKGTIFQPHSSHGSVTFLLTEAQNGNYFSFHYELSLFHLGTEMIDFHSSSVLPFLKPLTQTDTMQNARDLGAYIDNFWERHLLVLVCCFKYILKMPSCMVRWKC